MVDQCGQPRQESEDEADQGRVNTKENEAGLNHGQRSHLATTSGVAAGTRCYSRDVIVPNAGHMMHLQKGHEVFQREVAGFFKTP